MRRLAMKRETTRRGGALTSRGYLFELTGGDLCLDMANTVDDRPTDRPLELLRSYADLISWGEQAGAITREETRSLRRMSARRPSAARAALERAILLREALFGIFSSIARGATPPVEDLTFLNAALPGTLKHMRIVRKRRSFNWEWADDQAGFDHIARVVTRTAADLLIGGDLERVRVCAADSCAWLFLDTSRNRTRRWCDMSVCGNRSKARRHYERTRSAS
jgi:predicted RNA-binding Zn ribbon-like protein